MTNKDFNKIVDEQINYCQSLLCKKGVEYDADSDDRLHSFKVASALLGETPRQALAGMMAKHTISIYDLIRTGSPDLTIWTEKITDHINYLLLLKAVIMDEYGGQDDTL